MDEYTLKTKQWLDERFSQGVAESRYFAHRPIYGFGVQPSERNHTIRLAIAQSILKELNQLEGNTLADIGGGEGYIAALAKSILSYDSIMVELSDAACDRANELFGIPARCADIHSLPFADDSIDVVVLSEVIEHLKDPVQGMLECYRIAKNAVVLTTFESSPLRLERWCRMMLRDFDKNHAERTFFHPNDFKALFGNQAKIMNSCNILGLLDETKISREEAKSLIPLLSEHTHYNLGSAGIMVVIEKHPNVRRTQRISDEKIFAQLFDFKVPLPNVIVKSKMALPTWVSDKPTTQLPQTKNVGFDKFGTAKSKLSRLFVYLTLTLTLSYRFLFMKGTIAAKIRWVNRMIDKQKIAKMFGS